MDKVYVIADFLREVNKESIRRACEDAGYEAAFFDTQEEASGKVGDGSIIYCTRPDLIAEMPYIRWCHTANAGIDTYVRSGFFDDGRVLLTNSSGAYGRAISEHIIMVTLMLMRRMPEYQEITAARGWKENLSIRSIAGSNIAIVGTGNLGSTAAEKFRGLGAASIVGFNRSGREVNAFDKTYRISEFSDHVSDIDVLVMCVPGTSETEGLLDADKLSYLPAKAFVVNVGRGTSVDQDALLAALDEGRIAGAALDVVYPEPLPADHPLWAARNCIITPHISGDMGLPYTVDTSVGYFCENIRRFAAGEELLNRVSITAGY